MKICCDIDGVLADVREEVRAYLPDWKEYFKHTGDVVPINQVCQLIGGLIARGHLMYFTTGRPESIREDTIGWLRRHVNMSISDSQMLMRVDGDHRKSFKIKIGHFMNIQPDLIFEDEPAVVDMAVKAGFTVAQIHGYRITEHDGVPFVDKDKNNWGGFSFVGQSANKQPKEQTLLVLTYELGKVIEYNHKANVYGATGYYSDANQQKEMSDAISMMRMYCEQKGWNYRDLEKLGEEAYIERMDDIKKYGKKQEPAKS